MAVLPILKWPDPRLSEVCTPVPEGEDLRGLIADMFDTMYAAPGRGLAGPQVGVMKRVFVMDVTWKEGAKTPVACLNPVIEPLGEETSVNEEACLSIPGVSARVSRPSRIRLRWFDADWQPQEAELGGFHAVCAQHEADHLDGKVIFDRVPLVARSALMADYGALR
ncbi:peptide deformylase [Pseudooceanicola onchidii]|uniref:peptide deformylase n=1 Tax=Pseudooceanicola onchidii TaxID=2562279 RepID=UPI0010AA987C|nr:peptide deformylase [Pseudooceanicola onchidii]